MANWAYADKMRVKEAICMETKNIIFELRTNRGLSQDELAERICVTRQAVSRWENGETVPNTETLKLLSKLFDVSINTLLGSPRKLICQCCGMPLRILLSAKSPMATSTRIIANGAMRRANSRINRRRLCSTTSSPICPTRTICRRRTGAFNSIHIFPG